MGQFVIHTFWEDGSCRDLCHQRFERAFSNTLKKDQAVGRRRCAWSYRLQRGSLGTPGQDQRSRRACASRPDARYTQACPHRAFFEEPVRQDPDIALFELRRKCREVFLNNSLNVRHIFGFRPWIYWASELLRNYSDDKKSELVDLGFFLSVRESTRRHLQRNRNTAIDEERMAVDKT